MDNLAVLNQSKVLKQAMSQPLLKGVKTKGSLCIPEGNNMKEEMPEACKDIF